MPLGLRIRGLTFLGPHKEPASILFNAGLNVIYGASNTGKSFIVDTIDFMLGGRGPLRDMPERVGYDRILLTIETLNDENFTIQRNVEGGAFRVFENTDLNVIPIGEGIELAEQHSDHSDKNLSTFLLSRIGLNNKRVRRNKRGDTNSLSFRYVARLAIINEEEIIQQRSPLSDGNSTADTPNTSAFKLLLTGVDDSSLVAQASSRQEGSSRESKIELLDQLIKDLQHQVRNLAGAPAELEGQLDRLNEAMHSHGQKLSFSEARFREISRNRRDLLQKFEATNNRLTEIKNLLERFSLLNEHYTSDIERLRGIEEAGNLFLVFGESPCPLCGALPEHHRPDDDCDGNIDAVITAANAEASKIESRQAELKDTMNTLRKEVEGLELRLPKIESNLDALSQEINSAIAPNLRQLRTSYGQLADKKSEVREALGLHRTLKDLEDRRLKLLAESDPDALATGSDVGLPTSVVDKFAELILSILENWHFPDASRVHFDLKSRDLVINGKSRISYGKGLRAITQAAFSIGILEYCRFNNMPHPGFVILDSPLLSYREPDSQDDDLRDTDLNARFYEYLAKANSDRQFIIVENTDPPPSLQLSSCTIKFTGNKNVAGRFGLFPPRPDSR